MPPLFGSRGFFAPPPFFFRFARRAFASAERFQSNVAYHSERAHAHGMRTHADHSQAAAQRRGGGTGRECIGEAGGAEQGYKDGARG